MLHLTLRVLHMPHLPSLRCSVRGGKLALCLTLGVLHLPHPSCLGERSGFAPSHFGVATYVISVLSKIQRISSVLTTRLSAALRERYRKISRRSLQNIGIARLVCMHEGRLTDEMERYYSFIRLLGLLRSLEELCMRHTNWVPPIGIPSEVEDGT